MVYIRNHINSMTYILIDLLLIGNSILPLTCRNQSLEDNKLAILLINFVFRLRDIYKYIMK